MGGNHSKTNGKNKRKSNNTRTAQLFEDSVQRLLEEQRVQYDKKCQELLAKAVAANTQESAELRSEKELSPYHYAIDGLQNVIKESYVRSPPYLYPNQSVAASYSAADINPVSFQLYPNFPPLQDNGQGPSESKPTPSAPSAPPAPREPSTSRSRSRNTEDENLKCPSCNSCFGRKIFKCTNNHSSCSDCKYVGRSCGICRQSIRGPRDFKKEQIVSKLKVPCRHQQSGCKLYIKSSELEIHGRECPFKEQQCPLSSLSENCRWRGKLDEMKGHFDSMHPNHCKANVDTEMSLKNICNNSQQLHLIEMGVYTFLFHLKVSEADRNIYMAVQLIGTKMSANKWIYEIHVYNKSESRRKYTHTDNCSSANEPVNAIFKEMKCAVLPLAYATTFMNHGEITFKFFIKMNNSDAKGQFGNNQRGRGRGRN